MAWKKQSDPKRIRRNQIVLSITLLFLLIIVGFISWLVIFRKNVEVQTTPIESSNVQDQTDSVPAEETPVFDAQALQAALDEWVLAQTGTASVVIADTDSNVIAAYNADQVYFSASIYKLYVAYEGYRQVDAGEVNPDEQYINGNTRAECLDLMIRDSDSPCAEKWWNELGKLELTNILRSYGITNTSMTQITTTAQDARIMLQRIAESEGLSLESQEKFLDSMKTQDDLYRRGLPSGFSDEVTAYNKVGWNEDVEWHDVAIIETSDGRKAIITVLTENVGTANIRELANRIESAL